MESTANAVLLRAKRLIECTGRPAREDAAILVLGDRIQEMGHREEVEAPPGAAVIELGDRTLMPGLIDAHMHFFGVPSDHIETMATEDEKYRVLRAANSARRMLESGITACRCLGSSVSPALRRGINEGLVPGPRVVAAGEFICSTDGTWDHVSLPLEVAKATGMIADGVEGVREAVRQRVRSGSNVIKVGLSKGDIDDKYHPWGDDPYEQLPVYSQEEVRSLTAEAHLNRLKVSAHCIGNDAVVSALDGGVDVIEHGYGITEETRRRLVDENALLVSTFSQLHFHHLAADPFHYPHWLRDVFQRHSVAMRRDFERSLEAGVRYALGTDLIGDPTHPHDQAAMEFEIAVDWGMDPMQAIVAGTQISAEALGMERDIGTLELGKIADIIAVPGDPLRDIRVLQKVEFVVQGGDVVVDRTSPAPQVASA